MSVKAVERMRGLADERKREAEAEQRLVAEFTRLPKDSWTMRQVLGRITRPATEARMTAKEIDDYYDRRTLKLRRSLASGLRPTSAFDAVFLAELTPEEERLSEGLFYELMTRNWPKGQRKSESAATPEATECALGSQCCRAVRRRGHPVSGRSRFCSSACRGRARLLRKQRAEAA